MSQLDFLSLGMGGTTLLLEGTDTASGISGYAVQAITECTFSEFVLDETNVLQLEEAQTITAVTNASNEFTVADVDLLSVGDRVFIKVAGTVPAGLPSIHDGIYYIQAIDSASNEFKLSRTDGGSAIAITNDGTGFENAATVAKIKTQEHADSTAKMGTVGVNGSSNELDIVPASVAGNLDMFESGSEAIKIPAGLTVFLPVRDLTLTDGSCLVYTRQKA
jgi:hypothetical protein